MTPCGWGLFFTPAVPSCLAREVFLSRSSSGLGWNAAERNSSSCQGSCGSSVYSWMKNTRQESRSIFVLCFFKHELCVKERCGAEGAWLG